MRFIANKRREIRAALPISDNCCAQDNATIAFNGSDNRSFAAAFDEVVQFAFAFAEWDLEMMKCYKVLRAD